MRQTAGARLLLRPPSVPRPFRRFVVYARAAGGIRVRTGERVARAGPARRRSVLAPGRPLDESLRLAVPVVLQLGIAGNFAAQGVVAGLGAPQHPGGFSPGTSAANRCRDRRGADPSVGPQRLAAFDLAAIALVLRLLRLGRGLGGGGRTTAEIEEGRVAQQRVVLLRIGGHRSWRRGVAVGHPRTGFQSLYGSDLL